MPRWKETVSSAVLVFCVAALTVGSGCLGTDDPDISAVVVEPAPGRTLYSRCFVDLEDVILCRDVLDRAMDGSDAGDPCFVLTGHIWNGYKSEPFVTLFAEGYDGAGDVVAGTLDQGLGSGAILLEAAYAESSAFGMRLGWSQKVEVIRIFAHVSNEPPSGIDWRPIGASKTTRLSDSADVSDVRVDPAPGAMLFEPGDIALRQVSLSLGVLEKRVFDYDAGAPCFVLTGYVTNLHEENRYVIMSGEGCDAAGEIVSRTVDSAPIMGVFELDLDQNESGAFTMHVPYAQGVERIRLFGATYFDPPP